MEQKSLPLFFKNPQLLNKDKHKNAGIRQNQGMGFARNTNSIVITSAEFIEAAKHYPIVFTNTENPAAAVVVGLENNNYFVDQNNQWLEGAYIPAYARQYPFVFQANSNSSQLSLCVDEDSEIYTANAKGKDLRLFEKDGKPSELTNSALQFCGSVQKENIYTQTFISAVKALDLFTPQNVEAKIPSGRTIRMAGFMSIDQEKLRNLPDDKIAELHKKGYLALLYYIILSASNWNRLLVLAEKFEPAKKKA